MKPTTLLNPCELKNLYFSGLTFRFEKRLQLYFSKLYKNSKLLLLFFIFFIVAQLYINFKVGVVATPFLHYGMYSAKSDIPAAVEAWEIEIDNKRVELQALHQKSVDNLTDPLSKFYNLSNDSAVLYQTKRFLEAAYLPFNETNFHYSLSKEEFTRFYAKHLSKVLNVPVNDFKVYKSIYSVRKADFILISKNLFIHANY